MKPKLVAKRLKSIEYKSEIVSTQSLKPHPKNYRGHGADQLEHIIASLKQNGFYRNIVIAQDGTILAGHGVVEACKKIGLEKVPVVRLPIKPNDPRAMKVLTGDNEISNLGDVNDRLLSEILRDIRKDDPTKGLLGTGFNDLQLANLVFVTRHIDEIKDFNAAREWIGLPSYEEEDPTYKNEPVLMIYFDAPEEREKFVNKIGLKIRDKRGGRKWSTVYPFKERNDLKSVKFKDKSV